MNNFTTVINTLFILRYCNFNTIHAASLLLQTYRLFSRDFRYLTLLPFHCFYCLHHSCSITIFLTCRLIDILICFLYWVYFLLPGFYSFSRWFIWFELWRAKHDMSLAVDHHLMNLHSYIPHMLRYNINCCCVRRNTD